MKCPKCKHPKCRVNNTRSKNAHVVIRGRQCLKCGHQFMTDERSRPRRRAEYIK